jgi:hypothetical protein
MRGSLVIKRSAGRGCRVGLFKIGSGPDPDPTRTPSGLSPPDPDPTWTRPDPSWSGRVGFGRADRVWSGPERDIVPQKLHTKKNKKNKYSLSPSIATIYQRSLIQSADSTKIASLIINTYRFKYSTLIISSPPP